MTDEAKKPRKDATLILRLTPDVLKRLDRVADREFEPRSATARRALEAGLRQLERKK
jgi:predicted transcriptional regulator